MKILVTGGAGYIGSHTCVQLLQRGDQVSILDNFSNSSQLAIDRLSELAGRRPDVYEADLCDAQAVEQIVSTVQPDAVIHFAGLKAVGESNSIPLHYYHNNLTGTFYLLQAMQKNNCKQLVFSSSATVYGDPERIPIDEACRIGATNPYGQTKVMIEQILHDLSKTDPEFRLCCLRYFNPVGAHPSGLIGEDPNGIPNNLVPYIAQVAVGRRDALPVFGTDYDTPDGTGVRDYLHVEDLAAGHSAALDRLHDLDPWCAINLGTGQGYSVREMVAAFSKACGKEIATRDEPRRPGDIATCYAKTDRARELLQWSATRNLQDMCDDHWRWQHQNPQGYRSDSKTDPKVDLQNSAPSASAATTADSH
jgi:UDP-glucose 4-epimerase